MPSPSLITAYKKILLISILVNSNKISKIISISVDKLYKKLQPININKLLIIIQLKYFSKTNSLGCFNTYVVLNYTGRAVYSYTSYFSESLIFSFDILIFTVLFFYLVIFFLFINHNHKFNYNYHYIITFLIFFPLTHLYHVVPSNFFFLKIVTLLNMTFN